MPRRLAGRSFPACGECHTAEVALFGCDIVVTQRDEAIALAGQGMFDGDPLVTPIASRRQVLGVESHAKTEVVAECFSGKLCAIE